MNEAANLSMNSIDSILEDKVLTMTHLDMRKRFPMYQCVSQLLGNLLCGSALQKNGLAFLQDLDDVGMTLVDWQRGNLHCELIQHPENLKNHSHNQFHFANHVSCQ